MKGKSDKFGLEYFFRRWYFAYRFRAFRAMIRLYESYFKIVECLTGLEVFDGHGKKALDIRCALGVTTKWLASLGYEVIGLDVSQILSLAKRASPQLEFVRADAQLQPFASNSFDLIVAFDVFEHLPNPMRFVSESRRLLKTGGIVVVTAPSKSFTSFLYDLIRREKSHINLRKPKEVMKMFRKNFDDVIIFTRFLLPIPPHLFNKYFVIYDVPEPFAEGYILIASKKSDGVDGG